MYSSSLIYLLGRIVASMKNLILVIRATVGHSKVFSQGLPCSFTLLLGNFLLTTSFRLLPLWPTKRKLLLNWWWQVRRVFILPFTTQQGEHWVIWHCKIYILLKTSISCLRRVQNIEVKRYKQEHGNRRS